MDVFKNTNLSVKELEIEVKKAVSKEDYGKTAFLRDKIKLLKSEPLWMKGNYAEVPNLLFLNRRNKTNLSLFFKII